MATEPVEDKSSWKCTLFRPRVDGNSVEFIHVATDSVVAIRPSDNVGHYLCIEAPKNKGPVSLASNSVLSKSLMTSYASAVTLKSSFIDHTSLAILPKKVVFKGEDIGNYLKCWDHGPQFLQFSGNDRMDPKVHFEIVPLDNGDICIKSMGENELHDPMYWYCNDTNGHYWPGYIHVCATPSDAYRINHTAYHFQAVRVDGDNGVIAIRSRPSGLFCKRFTNGVTNCLAAKLPTVTDEARLVVDEPVLQRTIEVEYRLKDARIYNIKPVVMVSKPLYNETDREQRFEVDLSYTKTNTRTWTHSASVKTSVKTTFKTKIPFIVDGKIDFTVEGSYMYTWGNAETESVNITDKNPVTVPPMKRTTARVVATEAECDIPFSYKQIDLLADGTLVETNHDDGVYKGIHSYNFDTEIYDEPLPSSHGH